MEGGSGLDYTLILEMYRDFVIELETATGKKHREQLATGANRMRKFWADWQGEDSIHEMAFGEPCA